jgi:hypothetical protein
MATGTPFPWAVTTIQSVGGLTYLPSQLTFDVISEDLNENLLAVVVLDYQGPAQSSQDGPLPVSDIKVIDPGHLDPAGVAAPRRVPISYQIPAGTNLGCHSLTVIATHAFALGFKANPKDLKDVGTLTWWIQLEDPLSHSSANFATCLTLAGAGSDGGNTGVTE